MKIILSKFIRNIHACEKNDIRKVIIRNTFAIRKKTGSKEKNISII